MFRKMPFILLFLILVVGLTSRWIPLSLQAILYGMSLSIKSLIVFFLPVVVFALLFKAAVHFASKASKIFLLILVGICCSNFLSTWISYVVGSLAYHLDLSMIVPQEGVSLIPKWEVTLPKWIGNDLAMFSGLISGIFLGWLKPFWAKNISSWLENVTHIILKGILFVIPFFITGFVIKMNHDQVLSYIFFNYALIFAVIALAVFFYIGILYFIANRCKRKPFLTCVKNMLPAAIAGFGSMSSAASMPLTILGAEKNSRNRDIAHLVIPTTVNIHLMGDCFAIPIFAFAVLKSFGVTEPSLLSYLIFASYFVLAKFSVAAVPGGGILVMLPIIESHLGFNAEMLSLITALYILFDPVITCANILGNGAFALIIEKLSQMITTKELTEISQESEVLG